jgi:hypothetical protein
MNSASGTGTGYSMAEQALFAQYCNGNPAACHARPGGVHGLLMEDLKSFLNSQQPTGSYGSAHSSNWLGILFNSALDLYSPKTDVQPMEQMLGTLRTNLDDSISNYYKDALQNELDLARQNYENEIISNSDISLKNMQFLPMIKIGMMYRF